MTRTEFLNSYGPLIKAQAADTGILPELAASVAFIESQGPDNNFGSEPQTAAANNYFGIMADKSWSGDTWTDSLNRKWRKYDTVEDSIKDFFAFVQGNANYKPLFNETTLPGQAAALEAGHYNGGGGGYADLIAKLSTSAKKALDAIKGDAVEIGTIGALASIAALAVILWPKKAKAITGLATKNFLPLGLVAAGGYGLYYLTQSTGGGSGGGASAGGGSIDPHAASNATGAAINPQDYAQGVKVAF